MSAFNFLLFLLLAPFASSYIFYVQNSSPQIILPMSANQKQVINISPNTATIDMKMVNSQPNRFNLALPFASVSIITGKLNQPPKILKEQTSFLPSPSQIMTTSSYPAAPSPILSMNSQTSNGISSARIQPEPPTPPPQTQRQSCPLQSALPQTMGASSLDIRTTQRSQKQPIQIDYATYVQIYKDGANRAQFAQPAFGSSGISSFTTIKSDQQRYRELIFQQNLNKINNFNKQPSSTFLMGLNSFTDLSESQFTQIYTKLIPPQQTNIRIAPATPTTTNLILNNDTDSAVDWRCKSTNVFTQGQCGSCYVIAALDAIQISERIVGRNIAALSIQEILSCGRGFSNVFGCSGGYFDGVYQYVRTRGIGPALFYSYNQQARDEGIDVQCNSAMLTSDSYLRNKVYISAYAQIPNGDCRSIKTKLKTQVLSIGISSAGLQFYNSGTFSSQSTLINHAVALVGYYPTQGYLIKNSWGVGWGDQGYGFVDQSVGVCGNAMYPVLNRV